MVDLISATKFHARLLPVSGPAAPFLAFAVVGGTGAATVGAASISTAAVATGAAGVITLMVAASGAGSGGKDAPAKPPRSFNASNFRDNLERLTGRNPSNAEAHHVFPQKFAKQFDELGINIHNPRFGSRWETAAHRRLSSAYNSEWYRYLATNPTGQQVLEFGRQLGGKYGFSVGF